MQNILIAAIISVMVIWLIFVYNRFIMLRNRCANGYSQIDILLKRRHELIPELIDAVKGYTSHESDILDRVTRARTKAIAADEITIQGEAEHNLSGALKTLFAVMEAYPQLKANENYLRLQDELSDTEDKIRFSRQFYNDTVMRYNTFLCTFPNLIIARLLKFKERSYFELSGEPARPGDQDNEP